jgi:y4mF family transcriptional regulator
MSPFVDTSSMSTNGDTVRVSAYVDILGVSTYGYTMTTRIRSLHDLAAAIRGRRQELGLSQAQLAERAHVSRAWVNAFESGKPAAELRLVLAVVDALGLELHVGDRADGPPRGATVDLDQLLDDYERR